MTQRLRRWAVVLPVLLAVVPATAGTDTAFPYDDLDAVLDRHVSDDGLVDYDSLSGDRGPLDRFVAALGRVSPDNHPERFDSDEARLAYWMNAYNALMLRRVVDAWPIASVKKIKPAYGVFWMEKHDLGGERWTLRGLENKVIRDRFDEPRIHFGINCASASCPALPRRAWPAGSIAVSRAGGTTWWSTCCATCRRSEPNPSTRHR